MAVLKSFYQNNAQGADNKHLIANTFFRKRVERFTAL